MLGQVGGALEAATASIIGEMRTAVAAGTPQPQVGSIQMGTILGRSEGRGGRRNGDNRWLGYCLL